MPLSDREELMLSAIERGLRAEDPQFTARISRGTIRTPRARRRRRGAAVFIIGVVVLVVGAAVRSTMIDGFPLLSVLGFAVMFAGAIVAITGPNTGRHRTAPVPRSGEAGATGEKKRD